MEASPRVRAWNKIGTRAWPAVLPAPATRASYRQHALSIMHSPPADEKFQKNKQARWASHRQRGPLCRPRQCDVGPFACSAEMIGIICNNERAVSPRPCSPELKTPMPFRRSRKSFLSWIVCFAILMGSLAPTLSLALQSRSGEVWTEICTSAGAKLVRVSADDGKPAPALPGAHQMAHCPSCCVFSPSMAPTPAYLFSLPAPLLAREPLQAFPLAPRSLVAWHTAQPRAPPAIA